MTLLASAHLVAIAHYPLEDEGRVSWQPAPEHRLRPWLLAAAIGLFAAWLVSGLAPRRLGSGPEGASSREDLELDALNP
jgi:H+/Cl- antiporter ClcA